MTAITRSMPRSANDRSVRISQLVRLLLILPIASLASCQNTTAYQNTASVVEEPVARRIPARKATTSAQAEGTQPQNLPSERLVPAKNKQLRWLSIINEEFQIARHRVEQHLDVDLSNIKLQLVSDKPINTEVALETRRLVKNQFGHSAFADKFLDQVMHPLAGTYAALYSSRLSSVMISRPMLANYERSLLKTTQQHDIGKMALQTLLIHELVHAADDQLYRIHDRRALNFRASFAQSATFEGHAQWVTRQICEQEGCSAGLDALDNFMFSTNEENQQLTQPEEAISRSVLEYSYIEGERFITALAERENGVKLIDRLLRSPPLDPIQILAPETYPDTDRETRNQRLIRATLNVEHPWVTSPWIGVETSPLKGVDLRSDPVRRQAAVDGFTRLIRGMISMQFYDQLDPGAIPMEATVLQAESAKTATLFASMLHNNTQQAQAQINDEVLTIRADENLDSELIDIHIYRTAIDGDINYRTAIVVAGQHVVQVSGNTQKQELLDDYAIRVLCDLSKS